MENNNTAFESRISTFLTSKAYSLYTPQRERLCMLWRNPVIFTSCISKWRLLKIMFPNSCFYPSKWLRVQTITFARKIPLRLQVNWMGKIGYQDCKLPYCMATYRRPLVYAFFGFVKKWQDQASREILASFFITWTS